MARSLPLVLNFTQTHLCDTPFCNISRDNCAIPHKKTSTKEFCDTIATSITRYKKYRYWASKNKGQLQLVGALAAPTSSFQRAPKAHPMRTHPRNLLKLRNPDCSCPFSLSDNSILGRMDSNAPNAMIARLKLPSGPPNAVVAKGRNRGKTPNSIIAKEKRPRLLT